MKNLTKTIFGAGSLLCAAALMTACSSEDPSTGANAADGSVVFTLNAPVAMQSRAAEGESAKDLRVVVFDSEGKYLFTQEERGAFASSKTANIKVNLVNGETYTVAFWVDDNFAYEIGSDGLLSMGYDESIAGNADSRDAFYAARQIQVKPENMTQSISLFRPFALVNVATADLSAITGSLGLDISKSTMTVNGQIYNQLNLSTGAVAGDALDKVDFALADLPGENVTIGGKNYDLLAMNYVLAEQSGSVFSSVEVKLYDQNGTQSYSGTLSYNSVPGKRNFRTNIVGNLLTSATDWTINMETGLESEAIEMDGAVVEIVGGKVVCTTPALPEGVTKQDLVDKNAAGVSVTANGEVVYMDNNVASVKEALAAGGDLYLAPNAEIAWSSHIDVPKTGITIHGNGATVNGGECDFSVGQYVKFDEGSVVEINIHNLNNARVWGSNDVDCTVNINMKNCTFVGGGYGGSHYSLGMGMLRTTGTAIPRAEINTVIEDCYVEGVQVGYHTTHKGSLLVKNTTFKNVSIPLNIAKKQADDTMNVTVVDCVFDGCGLPQNDADSAWDYSAPVRVVDNGGPANATTVKVQNSTFINTRGDYDILTMDYRDGKTWFPVSLTVSGCGSDLKIRQE